jgi:hypothetical protein
VVIEWCNRNKSGLEKTLDPQAEIVNGMINGLC